MNAQAYHRRVIEIIAACPLVISLDIAFRAIDKNECYIIAYPSPAMDLERVLAQALAIVGEKLTRESST